MTTFQAVYYRDKLGQEPVNDFIRLLGGSEQVSIREAIALLNDLSEVRPHLGYPHSSQIEGSLRELRAHHGRKLYRILYRRSANLIVMLHAFEKRTGKIPLSDIKLAKARFSDFRKRMDEGPRRPPRPAGRDAP